MAGDDPKTPIARAALPAPKPRAVTLGDRNETRAYVPPRRGFGSTRAPMIVASNGVPQPAWNDDATGQYQVGAIDEVELAALRNERPDPLRIAHLEQRNDALVAEIIQRDRDRRALIKQIVTHGGTFFTGAAGTAIVVALLRGC